MTEPQTSRTGGEAGNAEAIKLAKSITVVRRDVGFLCLSLPSGLFSPGILSTLQNGLRSRPEIKQVLFDNAARQLTLRFDSQQLNAGQVAHHLFGLLNNLDLKEVGVTPVPILVTASTVINGAITSTVASKFKPLLKGALTETAVINFFNDLTAFYLVKVHWEQITKRWIKQPGLYTNAWLTTFYLIFLLVRYRKKFVNKPEPAKPV